MFKILVWLSETNFAGICIQNLSTLPGARRIEILTLKYI